MYSQRKEKLYELLNLFAQNEKLYQTELEAKLGISYRNVIRHLQTLEKEKLIESRLVPSEKQGPGRKVWNLTLEGLAVALMLKEIWQDNAIVKQVIKAHSDKLLVFKKWQVFEQAGLEDYLISKLAKLILDLRATKRLTLDFYPDLTVSSMIAKFDKIILLDLLFNVPHVWALLKHDAELKEFIDNIMVELEARLEREMKALVSLKETLRTS